MVKLFGSTINETVKAFSGVHLGGDNSNAGTSEDKVKAIGRIIISIFMLFLATYLFTIKDTGSKQTASTIIGALIGYWIK